MFLLECLDFTVKKKKASDNWHDTSGKAVKSEDWAAAAVNSHNVVGKSYNTQIAGLVIETKSF